MIALIQRVSHAAVVVDNQTVGRIDHGILALIGIEKQDELALGHRLIERILSYRIFSDADDKMNLCVKDISGGLLLVPQFTLAADTAKGNRPSFSSAKPPDIAADMFNSLLDYAQRKYDNVASGMFGADMKVSLLNDGPVTFQLISR